MSLVRSALFGGLVLVGVACDGRGPVLAQVGKRALHLAEITLRAAQTGQPLCGALERAIGEELLVHDWCKNHAGDPTCEGQDRVGTLRAVFMDSIEEATAMEVADAKRASEYLAGRRLEGDDLARTLVSDRKTRKRLDRRIAALWSDSDVVVYEPCVEAVRRVGRPDGVTQSIVGEGEE